MMITEDGFVKEDATIEVSGFEYANLIRRAEHYKNIVRAAIGGASFPVWSKEPRLNMDDVEEYLHVAEFELVEKTFQRLQEEKEQQERELREEETA